MAGIGEDPDDRLPELVASFRELTEQRDHVAIDIVTNLRAEAESIARKKRVDGSDIDEVSQDSFIKFLDLCAGPEKMLNPRSLFRAIHEKRCIDWYRRKNSKSNPVLFEDMETIESSTSRASIADDPPDVDSVKRLVAALFNFLRSMSDTDQLIWFLNKGGLGRRRIPEVFPQLTDDAGDPLTESTVRAQLAKLENRFRREVLGE